MADTRKLTMVFTLDNGDDFKYNLADPKDELTKSEVDVVMQKMIDRGDLMRRRRGTRHNMPCDSRRLSPGKERCDAAVPPRRIDIVVKCADGIRCMLRDRVRVYVAVYVDDLHVPPSGAFKRACKKGSAKKSRADSSRASAL